MVSKVKVDAIESTTGSGTIALNNQFSGMTVASLPTSGTLPALDGSVLTNLPGGGKILQVVQEKLATNQSSTATSYVNAFSANITPSSTSSKILVSVNAAVGTWSITRPKGGLRILNGSTVLQGISDEGFHIHSITGGGEYSFNWDGCILDSPGSTSQQTYNFEMKSGSGQTVRIWGGTTSTSWYYSTTMTLMEIAG
jgi:hypothetical protein